MEISSFYISVPEIMIIRYAVPEIWCVTDLIVIFHFGLFFALATSLTAHKIKISKQWKKHLEISSFYTSVPKIINRLYCSWDMTRSGCNFCFNLGLYFSFLPLYSPKNKNFKKMKKNKKILEILFYTCVPKTMIRWCTVPEIWCATNGQTDGRTGGRKRWHIQAGAPPNKIWLILI